MNWLFLSLYPRDDYVQVAHVLARLTMYMFLINYESIRFCTCMYHYPHAMGYCDHLRPSVILSPLKPFDEIKLNLACRFLTWMTAHFLNSPSRDLRRGQHVKYHNM